VNPRVAITVPMHVHRDEATAIERGIDGAHFFGYALAHYYVFGEHRPGRTDLWEEFQARREDVGFARGAIEAAGDALGIKVLEQGLGSLRGAIGTPEQVRDLLRRYEAAGVDQVMFVMQAGRTKHEHICEALELFGAEVAPEFAARADAADAARVERLGPGIEAALARRLPPRVLDDVAPVSPLAGGPPGRPTPANVLHSVLRRIPDRRLEQAIGSDVALRVFFTTMARRFAPERANGFQGELQYVLERDGSGPAVWTITVDGDRARAQQGPAQAPALTVTLSVADVVQLAGGELEIGAALFDGRMKLDGDLALATRLAPMFGVASPL
jgi:putative sterol carrier protein